MFKREKQQVVFELVVVPSQSENMLKIRDFHYQIFGLGMQQTPRRFNVYRFHEVFVC